MNAEGSASPLPSATSSRKRSTAARAIGSGTPDSSATTTAFSKSFNITFTVLNAGS